MFAAAQNADLGGSPVAGADGDSLRGNPPELKIAKQAQTVRIVAHYTQREGPAAESRHVGHRVRTAARSEALVLIRQDEDRRLPADSLGDAGDEHVRHQVRQHDDRLPGHGVHHAQETVGGGENLDVRHSARIVAGAEFP